MGDYPGGIHRKMVSMALLRKSASKVKADRTILLLLQDWLTVPQRAQNNAAYPIG